MEYGVTTSDPTVLYSTEYTPRLQLNPTRASVVSIVPPEMMMVCWGRACVGASDQRREGERETELGPPALS